MPEKVLQITGTARTGYTIAVTHHGQVVRWLAIKVLTRPWQALWEQQGYTIIMAKEV